MVRYGPALEGPMASGGEWANLQKYWRRDVGYEAVRVQSEEGISVSSAGREVFPFLKLWLGLNMALKDG